MESFAALMRITFGQLWKGEEIATLCMRRLGSERFHPLSLRAHFLSFLPLQSQLKFCLQGSCAQEIKKWQKLIGEACFAGMASAGSEMISAAPSEEAC